MFDKVKIKDYIYDCVLHELNYILSKYIYNFLQYNSVCLNERLIMITLGLYLILTP